MREMFPQNGGGSKFSAASQDALMFRKQTRRTIHVAPRATLRGLVALIIIALIIPLIIHFDAKIDTAPDFRELIKMSTLGKQLDALPKGNIFLHAPKAMKVGEKRKVEANVGINVPMEILRKQSPSGDQTFEATPRLSSKMIATLSGPGFKIDAVTPEQQTIAEGFPTVWSWNIEAREHGDQELEATLYALVLSPSLGTARLRVDSYTQTIIVSVGEQTWREWFEALGHEIDIAKGIAVALVGMITAVSGWFGFLFYRRKKNVRTASKRKSKRS
jgi:hypothetical protein